jgi:hypothetical protein
MAQYPRQAVFPLKAWTGTALLELDQRTVAGAIILLGIDSNSGCLPAKVLCRRKLG